MGLIEKRLIKLGKEEWIPEAEKYMEFGDDTGVREENLARMDFHTPANVTPSTPRISRD